MNIKNGDLIWFDDEQLPYIVRQSNKHFAICTQDNKYTIIDFKQNIRGQNNLLTTSNYNSDDDCNLAFNQLNKGQIAVSREYNKHKKINIVKIKFNEKFSGKNNRS